MSVRMVAIEETFGRFKCVVRDLVKSWASMLCSKPSVMKLNSTRTVTELILDPLKHNTVRNAIAHGCETPEERIKRGKSDTCRASANPPSAQRQGYVVIEVIDDGRGIDPGTGVSQSKTSGPRAEREKYSERQLLDLIFSPDSPPHSEVTELCGRGVGLDVVKRNVSKLRTGKSKSSLR